LEHRLAIPVRFKRQKSKLQACFTAAGVWEKILPWNIVVLELSTLPIPSHDVEMFANTLSSSHQCFAGSVFTLYAHSESNE